MVDLQIIRRTVMNCDQIFQTFFDCLCIHGTSTGKLHAVTKCDLYSCIVHEFIICCKPRLYFHIVIVFEKSFSDAITKCAPSGIIIVRV